MKEPIIHEYLRLDDRFPHVWCPGCGIGIVLGSLIRVIHSLKIPKEKFCLVSGIGCTSRMPGYLDTDTFHVLHGRAIPAAIGIKLARPEMEVVVIGGDGDILAIGGNHFIHAARRNMDMVTIIINNFNYGMTGGQYSPTTPEGAFATTAPYGMIEPPFDVVNTAIGAGAPFVARTTVYHVQQLDRYIKLAIEKKGFGVIEVVTNCPTLYGRLNKTPTPAQMMEIFKKQSIPKEKAEKMNPEELKDKIVIGIFQDIEKEDFGEKYKKLLARLKDEV